MAFTFRGGIHPKENKNTKAKRIEVLPPPDFVRIPLSQHIGAPCSAVVAVGDYVKKGQVIATPGQNLGANIHSSVSGTVREIKARQAPDGRFIENILIENDKLYTEDDTMKPFSGNVKDLTTDFVIEAVKNAGISGMGGAMFPTHAKIKSAIGKVNKLIINCCECEPYICANHRLMLEHPESIINGAKILLKALNLRVCTIAVEENKKDGAESLLSRVNDEKMFDIRMMKTKYPQGDERQIIYALFGLEIPAGGLPSDVECVVFNAETCASVYYAVALGKPVTDKIVTVDGDCVLEPKNILAPIGASFEDLIEFCGGLKKTPKKIIAGGPMMGPAQWKTDGSITKGTGAILALSKDETYEYSSDGRCIRCGRCARACPMHLMPLYLASYTRSGQYDMCEKYDVFSCVECGSCTYVCPGDVPIVQLIRSAKATLKSSK